MSAIINNISAMAGRQHKVIYMVGDIKGPGGIKGTPRSTERTGTSSKPVIIRQRSEQPPKKIESNEEVSKATPTPSAESLRDNFQKLQAARNVKEGLAEAISDINAFSPAGIKKGGKARSVGAALGNAKNNSQFQKEVLGAIDGPKPSALEHQAPRTVKISA